MPTGPFDPSTRTDLKTVRAGHRNIAFGLERHSVAPMGSDPVFSAALWDMDAFRPVPCRSRRKLLAMYWAVSCGLLKSTPTRMSAC